MAEQLARFITDALLPYFKGFFSSINAKGTGHGNWQREDEEAGLIYEFAHAVDHRLAGARFLRTPVPEPLPPSDTKLPDDDCPASPESNPDPDADPDPRGFGRGRFPPPDDDDLRPPSDSPELVSDTGGNSDVRPPRASDGPELVSETGGNCELQELTSDTNGNTELASLAVALRP
jgi:hypothetical protein